MKKNNLKYVAVDFDGTCVTHDYPEIGKDIGAVPVLKRLVENGSRIILWTMRSGKELEAAVNWFAQNKIPLFGVQRNPTQGNWTSSPKAYATCYIDDAAFNAPLVYPMNGKRPFIDWNFVNDNIFQ